MMSSSPPLPSGFPLPDSLMSCGTPTAVVATADKIPSCGFGRTNIKGARERIRRSNSPNLSPGRFTIKGVIYSRFILQMDFPIRFAYTGSTTYGMLA